MIRAAVTAILLTASISPINAAGIFFVAVNTKGYCSVVQPKPAPDSGLTIIGETDGYASKEAAAAALKAAHPALARTSSVSLRTTATKASA